VTRGETAPTVDAIANQATHATIAPIPATPTTHHLRVPGAGFGRGMADLRGARRSTSVVDVTGQAGGGERMCRRVPLSSSALWREGGGSPVSEPVTERLRLMCVHAHPDDESSKGAATMAKYVDEGHEVLVISCTGGERGDILNPTLKDDAHRRSSASTTTGSGSSIRACRRVIRCRRCPRAASPSNPSRSRPRPSSARSGASDRTS
jgi:hypothetical protein